MGGLYILDYGGGNVASLANSVSSLGFTFKWVQSVADIHDADKLIFPGVGSFGQAMAALRTKGYLPALRDYLAADRPYMGICIGLQALFLSSDEAPDQPGLGLIPSHIARFSSSAGKSVPCIGWNGAALVHDREPAGTGIGGDASYYFVHSFRADYGTPEMDDWTCSATRYGDEVYTSAVRKGNVFATQFHPEKSGQAGLDVLRAWLELPAGPAVPLDGRVRRTEEAVQHELDERGFTKRIVACLDVRANDAGDLVVTKGDQYDVRESLSTSPLPTTTPTSTSTVPPPSNAPREVRNLGKPVDLAQRYFLEGADEIAFLNITSFRSCPLHDQPMLDVVRRAAETVFVPLTIGGGIRDTIDPDGTVRTALDVAGTYFRCGADKVSIGSDAVYAVEALLASGGVKTGTSGIETISAGYGAQAVVVSIDPKRIYASSPSSVPAVHRPSVVDLAAPLPGSTTPLKPDLGPNGEQYCWYQCTVSGGRSSRDLDVVQLAQGAEALGAGELLLNSVDRDGSKAGFDLRLVALVRNAVGIPVVASSGAGCVEDFEDVFRDTRAEAALAAGIFHRKEVPIEDVKSWLRKEGVKVRVDAARR